MESLHFLKIAVKQTLYSLMRNFMKQCAPIRPPKDLSPHQIRPPNLGYVCLVTTFVSLAGFLFGWNQGVMAMIISDDRWLELMHRPDEWNIGFVVSIYNIGCVVGAIELGDLADWCGRERTLSLASVVLIIGTLIQATADNIFQTNIGRFIIGLSVGVFSGGVPMYISEISPAELRGRLVSVNLMILCLGEMVVFWIVYACYFLESPGWWRIPLLLQIPPAIVLAWGCWIWIPPSPRWLVAEGRYEDAAEVLARLHGSIQAEAEMQEICETANADASIIQASWSEMFRPPALRLTLLGCGIRAFSQITGTNGIFYYAPTLFRKGGIIDPTMANLATGGAGVILFLSAWIPIFYFDRLGRKTWLQIGSVGMFLALVGICVMQEHAQRHPGDPVNYIIVAFPYIFFTFLNMSWCPGSWAYAAEIFPLYLRAKGNALCTVANWVTNFAVAQISPPMEAATGWGLYAMFASFCIFASLFTQYALVETRGRTLEEITALFGLGDKGEAVGARYPERLPLLRSEH